MPRLRAPHGTDAAFKRHKREGDAPCAECVAAHEATLTGKREKPAVEVPTEVVPAAPVTDEGHISRLEVLQEMLQQSRGTILALRRTNPSRVYLLLREQREILAEIADLQGNGQVKGVTLADQLAEARARRGADAQGVDDSAAGGVTG